MKNKYQKAGLNYDLITQKFLDLNEYEEIVNTYLSDPFFKEIEKFLDDEDYALAKDATKGLYLLAQDLQLFPLYFALLEIYEDLESELYKEAMEHYRDMLETYGRIKGVFNV